jgi:hypothetical protein
MKTEQVLKPVKVWAKNTGYKIKTEIRKQPPAWVVLKNKRALNSGIYLTINNSHDLDSDKWHYFININEQSIVCKNSSGDIDEIGDFLNINELIEILDEVALEFYATWVIAVFYSWAEKSNYWVFDYILSDKGCYEKFFSPYAEAEDYEDEYFQGSGQIIILSDKIQIWKTVRKSGRSPQFYYSHMSELHSECRKRFHSPVELQCWLDENAKIGFLADRNVKHLDKKTLGRILNRRRDHPGASDLYLYELESSTDDAIKLLCSQKDSFSIQLSEKGLCCLKQSHLDQLIKASIEREGSNLYLKIDIGIFTNKILHEPTAWQIASITAQVPPSPAYCTLEIDLTMLTDVSEECAEILSYAELDYNCRPFTWEKRLKERVIEIDKKRREKEVHEKEKATKAQCVRIVKERLQLARQLELKLGEYHVETIINLDMICELSLKCGDISTAAIYSIKIIHSLKKDPHKRLSLWFDLDKLQERHARISKKLEE